MCDMCGQCCRMIHYYQATHDLIQSENRKAEPGSELEFVRENMEYLGTSEEIEGALKPAFSNTPAYIYKCKLITDDNKCPIHDNKPKLCSGYPYYGDGKSDNGSWPWPYKGCAYERDYYELRMLRVLKNYLTKISPKIEEVMIKERLK